MTAKTVWESFKADGETVIEKLKALIHEGNVRRVVVQHEGRTVAEFPLTVGVGLARLGSGGLGGRSAALGLGRWKDCTISGSIKKKKKKKKKKKGERRASYQKGRRASANDAPASSKE